VTDEPGTPKTALEKLRAKTLKTIILEDDIEVVIRGVGQDELMAAARMTPIADFESATEKELRKRIASAFTAKDGTFGIMVSEIVFRGVVEPKLFRGALKDCPDDALPLDALGPYRMHLLSEIMLMSGWEVDVVSAGKFRGGKGDVVDLTKAFQMPVGSFAMEAGLILADKAERARRIHSLIPLGEDPMGVGKIKALLLAIALRE
jgi:hypothetical protein